MCNAKGAKGSKRQVGPLARAASPRAPAGSRRASAGSPIAPAGNPIALACSPVARPGNPIARIANPVAPAGNPVARIGDPIARIASPRRTSCAPGLLARAPGGLTQTLTRKKVSALFGSGSGRFVLARWPGSRGSRTVSRAFRTGALPLDRPGRLGHTERSGGCVPVSPPRQAWRGMNEGSTRCGHTTGTLGSSPPWPRHSACWGGIALGSPRPEGVGAG